MRTGPRAALSRLLREALSEQGANEEIDNQAHSGSARMSPFGRWLRGWPYTPAFQVFAKRDDRVPAAVRAALAATTPPPWMRISGRTLHKRIPASSAEHAPVALDPDATPLLDRVLASSLGRGDHSRATFEVWLGDEGEHASVHIGIVRVGRLDASASRAVLPLIERARAGNVKLVTTATLRAGGRAAAHRLLVNVPPL